MLGGGKRVGEGAETGSRRPNPQSLWQRRVRSRSRPSPKPRPRSPHLPRPRSRRCSRRRRRCRRPPGRPRRLSRQSVPRPPPAPRPLGKRRVGPGPGRGRVGTGPGAFRGPRAERGGGAGSVRRGRGSPGDLARPRRSGGGSGTVAIERAALGPRCSSPRGAVTTEQGAPGLAVCQGPGASRQGPGSQLPSTCAALGCHSGSPQGRTVTIRSGLSGRSWQRCCDRSGPSKPPQAGLSRQERSLCPQPAPSPRPSGDRGARPRSGAGSGDGSGNGSGHGSGDGSGRSAPGAGAGAAGGAGGGRAAAAGGRGQAAGPAPGRPRLRPVQGDCAGLAPEASGEEGQAGTEEECAVESLCSPGQGSACPRCGDPTGTGSAAQDRCGISQRLAQMLEKWDREIPVFAGARGGGLGQDLPG